MTDIEQRIERVEGDMYRTDPDNPGMVIQIDRINHNLKLGYDIGRFAIGAGLAWKVIEFLVAIAVKSPAS